ncbi:AAA domain-containing protein [Psychrobium sp. 1_MG-2023]|uniref:AAA domain-containing protein n=1 Tax=Psychrobium sp. 1_MG-2023 TaxID=3062624 RepID=UPI000C33E0F8|nr:AAA domain-containing protein [Psychrobium sp. 1_MG-2023]PKF54885.1 DNA helicase [Alteromonadales bacterium alter-6D02]
MDDLSWIRYWRNSLADADSGKGALKKRDLNGYHPTKRTNFSLGMLEPSDQILEKLFADENDNVLVIKAHYRPVLYTITKQHRQDYRGTTPQVLSPVICPIWITREGLFFSAGTPYIPRDILAPQADDKFTIAAVSDLDDFLTTHSTPSYSDDEIVSAIQSEETIAEQSKLWTQYYELAQGLFRDVCSKQKIYESYTLLENGVIGKIDDITGASTHILSLYDKLTDSNHSSPLFHSYATQSVSSHEACLISSETIADRLGHSNAQFPLAKAQRDALSHALNMSDSDILAVNGPPGTGKTTFVLSVVASLWIESALKEAEPPLIIAASTNNQAVTNVIDAFGKDFDEGNDELSGRWLPDVSSYGGYFPSAQKEDEASKKYQTRSFYSQLESLEYLDRAETHFIERAQASFAEMDFENTTEIKEHLLNQLKLNKQTLNHIQICWEKYSKQKQVIENLLGIEPEKTLEGLKQELECAKSLQSVTNISLLNWRNYLSDESIWLSIFSWLPFVLVKREAQRKNFIHQSLCVTANKLQCLPENLESAIEKVLAEQKIYIDELTTTYQQYLHHFQTFKKSEAEWNLSTRTTFPESSSIPSLEEVDSALDITVRFRMFRLAVHYWEARWLLTYRGEEDKLEGLANKTGLKAVLPRWKRRMMLTPCIVSTFHSLPSHMTYQAYAGESDFRTEYLINEIDLLIVDEAGQVSPDVAGASFSLAKKALVIGDIYQIEPVRQLNACIDIGNLKQSKLMTDNDEYESIQASGRSVVTGSVMHLAQRASRYHYKTKAEPGMFLQEHRRCYDELISYCNELCYSDLLIAKRGSANLESPYPPFGYLHVDGLAELFGGSRGNRLEAETIASWLASNRSRIEEYFEEPLEKAVGVITPFSAQVAAISSACNDYNIPTGKAEGQLTVGTVHSFQGAERKLVIFSQVYTKHSNGSFIDINTSMLNVAVSRAKDSFLVFGDMDIIAAVPKSKPRGLLSKYLLNQASNELKFNTGKRPDLLQFCGQPKLLHNADEHDAFVMQLLDKAVQKVDIVSPWIIYEKLKTTGILAKLQSSISRGVAITIYTDKHFNTTVSNRLNAQKQRAFEHSCTALKELGVCVNVIDGIHSKIIFADNKYMTVGSFNWFSAAREGKYANVETSLVYAGDLAKETKTHIDFLNNRIYRQYVKDSESTEVIA